MLYEQICSFICLSQEPTAFLLNEFSPTSHLDQGFRNLTKVPFSRLSSTHSGKSITKSLGIFSVPVMSPLDSSFLVSGAKKYVTADVYLAALILNHKYG